LGCSILVADDAMGCAELAQRGLAKIIPLSSTPTEVAAAISNQIAQPFQPKRVVLPTWDGCARSLQTLYRQVKQAKEVLSSASSSSLSATPRTSAVWNATSAPWVRH